MTWNDVFEKGNELVLSTVNPDGSPHSIVVMSQGFVEEKLLIAGCQMKKTLENIRKSDKVCVVGMKNKEYYSLNGLAKIHRTGTYLETAQKRNDGPVVHCAIVIYIQEIFDLDKIKKVF
jgi:general stress protein 26